VTQNLGQTHEVIFVLRQELHPDLLERLQDPEYPGKVERAILFSIEAWDVNCPQHIHKRFPQREVAPIIENLQDHIGELELKLAQYENAD
jgi:hypothetical protein